MYNIIEKKKMREQLFIIVGGGAILVPIGRDRGEEAEGISNTPLPPHTHTFVMLHVSTL